MRASGRALIRQALKSCDGLTREELARMTGLPKKTLDKTLASMSYELLLRKETRYWLYEQAAQIVKEKR